MTSRRAVVLVAWREIEQRVRSKMFLFSTLGIVLIVIAAALTPGAGNEEHDSLEIGLVGRAPAELAGALSAGAEAAGDKLESHPYATLAAGERALRDEEVGVLVVDGSRLVWKAEPDDRLQAVAAGALQQLAWRDRAAALGLTPTEADALLAQQSIPERRLEPPDSDADARRAAALLGITLLLLGVGLYGGAVANGVAQEKATRVIEVLLSRVTSRELLTGKVIGLGLVGVAQLLLALLVSLAAVVAFDQVELPAAVPSVVAWVIVWFVLGYAFFSVLYAAAGALVSRLEDLENAKSPIGYTLLAGAFLAFYATEFPDEPLARIASFVPVTAPFVVPVRAAVSDIAAWEVGLAVAIMVAATYAIVRIAAGVYSGAVLRVGPTRLRGRDVLRAARAARAGGGSSSTSA